MPALIPLDDSMGAALIGLILSAIIYGVTCLQVYLYYTEHCQGDKRPLKTFVAALMALDTLHFALISHTLYFYTITNFGDYERLARVVWSLVIQVGVGHLITCLVQTFFAWRIYVLSGRKNWWLPMLVLLCGLGLVASAIAFMVNGFRYPYFSQADHNLRWTIGGLTAELAGDTLMTAGMTIYLTRGRTAFDRTDQAINLLITYTLNTGLLTTVLTVLVLAMYVASKNTLLYMPFFFILERLYSCALMSTLNSRKWVRAQMHMNSSTQESYTLSNIGRDFEQGGPRAFKLGHGAEVYVSSTKETI